MGVEGKSYTGSWGGGALKDNPTQGPLEGRCCKKIIHRVHGGVGVEGKSYTGFRAGKALREKPSQGPRKGRR